jgi:hypothetical protein
MGVKLGRSYQEKTKNEKVLRKTCGPERENGENYIMRTFIICTAHQILFASSNEVG